MSPLTGRGWTAGKGEEKRKLVDAEPLGVFLRTPNNQRGGSLIGRDGSECTPIFEQYHKDFSGSSKRDRKKIFVV
ncbi:hypothetical protein CEXT_243601 [Caerostris extrusa]|uniref:Uncharacterized protein n=1 Tax=Caerostris extrusa TaxID=172846 RepID=A0AAV4RYY2_CAEEX|nr:hypothetical protein CEXT_243601 [Caerostris extrusa]